MKIPRRCSEIIRRFQLDNKKVLDCGCGNAPHLPFFGPGSVGLELQDACIQSGLSKGLDVRKCNLEQEEEWPVEEASFDAVWCSAYVEHSLSPHSLLMKARRYLKPGGTLIILVPIVQPVLFGCHLFRKFRGWRGAYAKDHVNFFTEYTVKETVRRAGFDRVNSYVGSFRSRLVSAIAQIILKPFWFSLLISGRKIPDWNYPEKAHKTLINGKIEFKD